jgi:SEC-C motif domain protein
MCPCCGSLPYADCCGRFHAGALHLQAPDAEALMRSRYSAYVLQLDEYLSATWHPSTRPRTPFEHAIGLRWLGLDVLRYLSIDADYAQVEFVARSKLAGRANRLRECSRFIRESGRWLYLDAAGDTALR